MNKPNAITIATSIATAAISASEGKVYPNADYADNVADFIERLANRLQEMDK
jgi:hypothetical protein